jgi:hypothetical protein
MLSFLIHSLFLLTAIGLTFVWVNHPTLSLYTLQLIAFFILFYFLNTKLKTKNESNLKKYALSQLITAIIFTMVVLLLVVSTGSLSSPLFFLIYFLLFGLSLTLEPTITVSLSGFLIIFFLLTNPLDAVNHLTSLASLILITPLSLFFGKQYLKVLAQKGKIRILKQEAYKLAKDIETEEDNILLWLSLNFRHSITQIIDSNSQILENPGLSLKQQDLLKKSLTHAKKLLQTGRLLKEKIDKQTD